MNATEKQKNYMNDLGIKYSEDISKKDASNLISNFLSSNKNSFRPNQKEKAFLEYMGVNVDGNSELEKILDYYHTLPDRSIGFFSFLSFLFKGELEKYKKIKQDKNKINAWEDYKLTKYPAIFIDEISCYFTDNFRSYVRSRYVNCSERLTEEKIRDTILQISELKPNWLFEPQPSSVFLEALQQLYPGCCDGTPPKRGKISYNDNSPLPVKNSSGCLIFFVFFIILSIGGYIIII